MKKAAIYLLLFALLLQGCGAAAPPETTPVPAETEPGYGDHLLASQDLTGTFEDSGFPLSWNFHLPKLLSDSPDAQAMNRELQSLVPQGSEIPPYDSMTYEAIWQGSLLSLLLTFRSYPLEETVQKVYLFDFETETRLTSSDLALRSGWESENLQKALVHTAASWFDRTYSQEEGVFHKIYWDLRAQTLGKDNLNLQTVPLYLNAEGALCGLFPIAVSQGSGLMQAALPLQSPIPLTRRVTDGYADCRLENGSVTVTFSKTEDSKWELGEAPQNTPIAVDRLYGNYVDLAIGNIGSEFWPVLLLLDENGMISFCSLMEYDGLTKSLHGIGPIACEQNVAAFSKMESEWGTQVPCGLSEKGENIDLYHVIYDSSVFPSPYFHATLWTTEDGKFTARFPIEDPAMSLYWNEDGKELASGLMNCQGMDEEGIHYSYSLFADSQTAYGTMTLHFPLPDSGEFPWITVTNDSQVSFNGLAAGEHTTLHWANP